MVRLHSPNALARRRAPRSGPLSAPSADPAGAVSFPAWTPSPTSSCVTAVRRDPSRTPAAYTAQNTEHPGRVPPGRATHSEDGMYDTTEYPAEPDSQDEINRALQDALNRRF